MSDDAVFEAAVEKFVKQVGNRDHDPLIGVPCLNKSNDCVPLQIILKKNRKWFWQKPKYNPSDFQLQHIVVGKEPVDVKVETINLLKNYKKSHKLDADGKVGGSLFKILTGNVEGKDDVSLNYEFEVVDKDEVNVPELTDVISSRTLNMSHPLIEQIKKKPRYVPCVVTTSVKLGKDASINASTDYMGGEKLEADKLPSTVVTGAEEEIKVESQNKCGFTAVKGTVLAFNVHEMIVKENGSVSLVLDGTSKGGFFEAGSDTVDYKVSMAGDRVYLFDEQELFETYQPILNLSEADRDAVNDIIFASCKQPKTVQTFRTYLKEVYKVIKRGEKKTVTLEYAKSRVWGTEDSWIGLLTPKLTGFTVQKNDTVVYPTTISTSMNCIRAVFEALVAMDDSAIKAFSALKNSAHYCKALIALLTELTAISSVNADDGRWRILYGEPNDVQEFLNLLEIEKIGDKIHHSGNDIFELEGAQHIAYAVWGQKE